MSSITAQQTKLDLELVPKENRLDIKKCNGRIPRGLTPREPIFQVVLDAIAPTPCYLAFLIIVDVLKVYKKQEKMYYPRFTKAIIHHFLIQEKTLSWRNKIRMHTSKDDYLINSLRFVFTKESTQIYEAILPECLTSLEMKESKVEPPIETKSKRKEKVDVTRGKGIKLLSEIALTEEAQMKEVRKKSLRDFHKSHPSGSGTVSEKQPRVDKITPTVTSEGTGDKPRVFDVTEDDPTENGSELDSESDQQEYEEEVKDDDEDDDDNDKFEGDKDRGMDDTTNQFSDDVQDKKADVEMTDAQNEKENLNITQEQVFEDAHVTITTVAKESEVPDASFSHSSDLASKFLNFLDIHPNDAKIVSPLDVHVLHETVQSEEPEFQVRDTSTPQGQEENLEKLDWENPEGDDYLFDLSKPLPLIMHRNRQSVPVEFFINNDLKYQKGGISTMTYTMSTTKTKAAQYDLPGIKDMREQRKSFYAHARGMQSRRDVYSTKRILVVTHVSVMRKHGYGYLEEIVVRRADNVLYRFKEGDDVADFALALRMFTRSLVIQKRVKDLQLRVESYQKQINVTKHDTTRPDLKKDTLTLHTKTLKDSFMLLSSLKDITKNIDMEYLSNKRWSTLEKKRAYFMIKDINKLLKERMRMRSLEKLVGSRLYRTDLKMLQRTI
nr:hypothetical protein [Tanacetum cinerariifolium]